MKTLKLFMLILLFGVSTVLFAGGQTPEDGYRTYLQALLKAERLTDLDPYIPAHLVRERDDLLKKISFKNVTQDIVMQRFLSIMQNAKKVVDIRSVREIHDKSGTKSSVGNPMANLAVEAYNHVSKDVMTFTVVMEFDKNAWKFAGEKIDKKPELNEIETTDHGEHRLEPATPTRLPDEPKQNASR